MQRCTRCGTAITPELAKPEPEMLSGVSSWCRPCHVAGTREWRRQHIEVIREQKRAIYRADPKTANAKRMALHRQKYPLTPRLCVTCRIEFTPPVRTNQKYCTKACQNRHRWGQRISMDPGIKRKILDRDGWLCYLCNRPIDPNLRWPHELSGTVDHVIPYAVCQHNYPDNLRAAHWRCNYDKGDALPGVEVWVPT